MSDHQERASKRVIQYLDRHDESGDPRSSNSLRDLLTDVRHYADKADLDFRDAVDRSYDPYLAERGEDGGQDLRKAVAETVALWAQTDDAQDGLQKIAARFNYSKGFLEMAEDIQSGDFLSSRELGALYEEHVRPFKEQVKRVEDTGLLFAE